MKTPLFFLLTLTLFGCASTVKYNRTYQPVDSSGYSYEDKNVKMTYQPVTIATGVPLTIENKSDKPIKVVWDESSFLNESGNSERIMHDGVKFNDRNSPMVPTVIPPHGRINDAVTPTSRAHFDSSEYGVPGLGWLLNPLCGQIDKAGYIEPQEKDDECVGKTFGLFITYEIDGKKTPVTLKYKYSGRSDVKAATNKSSADPSHN